MLHPQGLTFALKATRTSSQRLFPSGSSGHWRRQSALPRNPLSEQVARRIQTRLGQQGAQRHAAGNMFHVCGSTWVNCCAFNCAPAHSHCRYWPRNFAKNRPCCSRGKRSRSCVGEKTSFAVHQPVDHPGGKSLLCQLNRTGWCRSKAHLVGVMRAIQRMIGVKVGSN